MFNTILLKVMEQQKHTKRTFPVVYITPEINNEIIYYLLSVFDCDRISKQ